MKTNQATNVTSILNPDEMLEPRLDAPCLSMTGPASVVFDGMVDRVNKYLAISFPGTGFYAQDVERDCLDDSKQHYMLYADKKFYDAYMANIFPIVLDRVAS